MTLDQKLEQPEISSINPELAELQKKAIEVATYYYKGFGTIMPAIVGITANFLDGIVVADSIAKAYEQVRKIESFYQQIPFDQLQGREEFYPLFKV